MDAEAREVSFCPRNNHAIALNLKLTISSSLNAKAAAKHPAAYKQASAKYPSPADF